MGSLGDSDSSSSGDGFARAKRRRGTHDLGSSSRSERRRWKADLRAIQPINNRAHQRQALQADALPLDIDPTTSWGSIGGLDGHVASLKEMVLLPLLYPEVFSRFQVQPPRGVLFYGPPGTGKTLVARALANSCTAEGGRRIAFFMRKGADCLSKWVGEAERQLRLLFEQARQHQPSIIFFDEIDGLAPVRSSKQDQIHASIVSTLLALMDGLDSRGQVLVLGATNKPDHVDPALRRPGRFDRELEFKLPTLKDRRAILDIHTRRWDPPLSDEVKTWVAEEAVGYCGADLKALCAETALRAFRRRYPQVYRSDKKLLIDPSEVKVQRQDFADAMTKLIPAAHRSAISAARPIPKSLRRVLQPVLECVVHGLRSQFPAEPGGGSAGQVIKPESRGQPSTQAG